MLQLDFSDPVHSISILVLVVVTAIWIIAELRLEGGVKSAIRLASAAILCVLFMFIMYITGMIVF